jgi:hypothetical protein
MPDPCPACGGLPAASTEDLYSEIGRRRLAARKAPASRAGRKPKPTHCPRCKQLQPSAQLAKQHCLPTEDVV